MVLPNDDAKSFHAQSKKNSNVATLKTQTRHLYRLISTNYMQYKMDDDEFDDRYDGLR